MPTPKKAATTKRPRAQQLYGASWPISAEPAQIELACIKLGGQWADPVTGATCGLGLCHHIIAFSRLAWPWFFWHRWNTDVLLPEMVRNRCRLAIFGPSSTGKSSLTSLVNLVFYFANPDNTTVLITSTTREALELRIWGEIKMFFREAKEKFPWLPGNLTDSKQCITTDGKEVEGRDARNGVIGRPTKRGNEWVGLGDFVGIKNDHIRLIADEANLMPDGFLKSIANLASNPNCCSYVLGNLNDLSTPLGQAAEPLLGWDSLPDSDVSRAYDTRWQKGRAVQLIGKDSPNLDHPEGHEPFEKLIGRQYIQQCAEDYGLDTPLYNMFASGKIPRGTLENRVITKQVLLKFNAFEPVTWGSSSLTKLYCADISYTASHGDRTCGMPLAFGLDNEGVLRLAPLARPTVYTPNDRAIGSIEDQLAFQMRAECKQYDIPPEHVFYDGTGRSSFTAAVMRLWSVAVNPIEFGGNATDRPNFIGRKYLEDHGLRKKGDLLPCSEVFGKMVTELWFAWRYCVEADQLRGLFEEIAKEGYLRLWFLTKGNKVDVEPKDEMKLRLGRSPDLADMLVVGLEGARRLGFRLGQLDGIAQRNTDNRQRRSSWLSRLRKDYEEARKGQELITSE